MTRRVLAPALAVVGFASLAAASPTTLASASPRFTLTVPDRFRRVDVPSARADVLGVFERPGDLPDEPPMVLQVLHLDAEVPQRALLPRELAELRRADGFPFEDHVERDVALGFSVDTLAGSAPLRDGTWVQRWATAVPLDYDAVLVVLLARSHRATEARALHRAIVASVRGPTNWETPARRAVNRGMRAVALGALVGALVAAVAWRSRRMSSPALRALAFALGVAWGAVTLWLAVPWRAEEAPHVVVAACLAVGFAALAARSR